MLKCTLFIMAPSSFRSYPLLVPILYPIFLKMHGFTPKAQQVALVLSFAHSIHFILRASHSLRVGSFCLATELADSVDDG